LTVRHVVRTAAPWIEGAARLGYVSIGTVYIIVGFMTAAAAIGVGGKTATWGDALRAIGAMPLGTIAPAMPARQ
jgi:hypothetical protein